MKNMIKKALAVCLVVLTLISSTLMMNNTSIHAEQNDFIQEFEDPNMENRPRTRWWVPGSQMTNHEIEKEIKSMVDAGFGGAEIVPVATDGEGGSSIDWGTEQWNEMIKHILHTAGKYGFTIDFTMTPAWPLALPTIEDVNDPNQGAQMELDGAYQDGITKDNPFDGEVPQSTEAIADVEKVDGDLELVAVTVAKYENKESKILDFDSAQSIEFTKSNDTYVAQWIPQDDGEYVLFGWWQHPSGNQKYGNNQVDHYSKNGTQMIIDYWENTLIPYYGEDFKNTKSLFIDSLEFETHLDWTYGLLEGFKKNNDYDISVYLPAIYDNDAIGNYMGDPEPDFSFNNNNETVSNDFKDYLTSLYVENHIQPLQAFCNSHDVTLRYQTSYGKNLETATTAMYVDIPETETLYGDDYIDFYRLQSGSVHLTDKPIYSIEAAAEWTEQWNSKDPETGEWKTRGNGEKDSGNYQQTFQSQAWHVQRAFAGGVNQVVFHGYAYNGQYNGVGNENGFVAGTKWPGFDGFSASTWSNSWGERQPNWVYAKNYTDFTARNQYVLRAGEAKVDLAIYNQSYYETIDFIGSQKIYDDNSFLEQSGYTYDFVNSTGFALDNATVENGCLDINGPSYQAIILNQQVSLPYETAQKFLEYAKQGLHIIVVGEAPKQSSFYNEEAIEDIINELLEQDTVMQIASIDEVPEILKKLSINPSVSYDGQETLLNVHRQSEDMDLYYLYNYGNIDSFRDASQIENVKTTITLKGTGKPYILDAWTGDIVPVAKYTVNNDSVTLELELAGNESTIIALFNEENYEHVVSSNLDVEYNDENQLLVKGTNMKDTVTMNDGQSQEIELEKAQDSFVIADWDLSVESWTPGDTPVDMKKTNIDIGTLNRLTPWNQIEGLEDTSGIGTYTATFNLENGWDERAGAYIDLGQVTDTFALKINDKEIISNQINTKIDIGKYIKIGENTIEIKVASTLLNAILLVNEEDGRDGDEYGLLTNVTIIPYSYQILDKGENPPIDQDINNQDKQSDENQGHSIIETGDNTAILGLICLSIATIGIIAYLSKKNKHT